MSFALQHAQRIVPAASCLLHSLKCSLKMLTPKPVLPLVHLVLYLGGGQLAEYCS